MKVLNRIIGFSAVFCVLCILFSLFFPGNIRFVDNIRLFFQKPLVRWAGKIHIKPVVSEDIDINFDELRDFIKDLPPGSIFFTRTRNYPLCELIPGEWKHSGGHGRRAGTLYPRISRAVVKFFLFLFLLRKRKSIPIFRSFASFLLRKEEKLYEIRL